MGSIVITELLTICVFTLWPVYEQENTYQDIVFSDRNVVMEEVQITSQKSSPPSPPKPQVPIPVPNDEIIEEEIVTQEDVNLSDYTDSLSIQGRGPGGDSNQIAANPQQPPSIVRIVEPTVPEAAKRANVKAEIVVSFLVNKKGEVEEASISTIKVYEGNSSSYNVVDRINYGLAEATLEAALQWKFRPAKNNGSVVRSYTKHIFSFGF